ncbi:MAG: ThuA domain-containing protein [Lewinellaceae bacterium]|nr:ThuA domain-containing protein [Lewinellaceae bacterium]
MKFNIPLGVLLLLLCLGSSSCFHNDDPPRVLIFSKTAGYRHASIPAGIAALRKMAQANSWVIDTTENAADFNEKNLKRYAVVVFLNTTGDVLDPTQEADFERFIQAGGGFMGIHAATDTEYGWKWYGGLVGAYFNGHPAIQEAKVNVLDHQHPATQHLKDDVWTRTDEWYNFKEFNPQVKVLLSLDEQSYQGGTMGDFHPLAWCHEYDGGRAFYTEMGHTEESYAEPDFLKHLEGGMHYVLGKSGKKLAYENCKTERRPDPTRFVKTVLASDLTEPVEFDMLPNDNILLIERRGAIKLYETATGMMNIVYKLPVYSENEDGLMGLALDPQYAQNHWIYLYYSPIGNKAVNRLSRFVFDGFFLDPTSERMILEVGVQRQECCHTGGSIEFDTKGNLFLSTGDNTNPFASSGYAPMDERPGRSPWDAQKSSANTMDLRGKILRIKPLPDGSYICPAGNLFTERDLHFANFDDRLGKVKPPLPGTQGGAPEIYVMGCRNPYRISVDSRRNLLFWGEVGPDAGEPDSLLGPAGHDEINRARFAGFFGWPYFVGDNKPYADYNFASKKNGPAFDPTHPINDSPNNTGARELPPAQPAFVWYPYGNSPDFPLVENGGRTAMAGPVYYTDQYPAATRFPDYFNGKLIAYEWMRNWMMAITLDSMGNFSRMDPICENVSLSRPMDMLVDKNGSIWVLEYGVQWFAQNPDARLSRIDYVRGNRAPKAVLEADKTAGAAPCTIAFSIADTKDYDGDHFINNIQFNDGTAPWTNRNQLKYRADSIVHTFAKPGTYEVVYTATDSKGASSVVKQKVFVGNEPPVVYWDFGGRNRSFYQTGDTLHYRVSVADREDGSVKNGRIPTSAVAVSADYLATGFDITQIAQGHQSAKSATEYARGKVLIERSDCKSCHATDRKINGPAFVDIAQRYRKNDFAVRDLSQKIIKGGAGNWGETVMSAHPQISEENAAEMVRWILSLGAPEKPKSTMPLQGDYVLKLPPPAQKRKKVYPGTFILQASYRDQGSDTQAALEGAETIALRPAYLQAETADTTSKDVTTYWAGKDTAVLKDLKHRSFFGFKHVDLQGLYSVAVGIASSDYRYQFSGGVLELRVDNPDGPLLGAVKVSVDNTKKRMVSTETTIQIQNAPKDGHFHDLYFVVKNEGFASQPAMAVDWVRFNV